MDICEQFHLEPSVDGCLCDGIIIIICVKYSRDHFTDKNKDHNPVDLDLALRMQDVLN